MGSLVSISDLCFDQDLKEHDLKEETENDFRVHRIKGTDLFLSNCPSTEDDVHVMRRIGINSCITLQECSESKLALKCSSWLSCHLPTNPYIQVVSRRHLERGYQFVKERHVCLRETVQLESQHHDSFTETMKRKSKEIVKERPRSRCVIHCMDGGRRSKSLIRYILFQEGYKEEDICKMLPKSWIPTHHKELI